jgi:hypothetical protein
VHAALNRLVWLLGAFREFEIRGLFERIVNFGRHWHRGQTSTGCRYIHRAIREELERLVINYSDHCYCGISILPSSSTVACLK